MSSIHDIKKKIEVLTLFKKATNAMKLVALSGYHKLKKLMPAHRKEFMFNQQLIENFFQKIDSKKIIHIFVGSNRGFCGDYNIALARHFLNIKKNNESNHQVNYFIFGKMLATKINIEIDNKTIFYQKNTTIENIDSVITFFYAFLQHREIDTIIFHYTASEGFTKKEIKTISVNINKNLYEINSSLKNKEAVQDSAIANFLYYYFSSVTWYVFCESLFSENGIRFITMDSSYRNAEESLTQTKKAYFKKRQEKINAELGDLVGSLLL